MSFPQIVTDWIEFLKENKKYSPNTLEAYISDVSFYIKFLKKYFSKDYTENSICTIKMIDFRAFLSHLTVEKKLSTASKARTISTIRNLYKFYNSTDPIEKNEVAFLIKTPKFNKPLPRALDITSTFKAIEEICSIELTKKNQESWAGFRDKVLLKLIYSSGLRISEALNVTIGELDNKFLRIKGKGNKERIVPLLDEVREDMLSLIELCPYTNKQHSEGFVFLGKQGKKLDPAVFQKVVRILKNSLGFEEGTTPHAFRHSFATHLLSNSGDILSIQELLGHSNISTTQRYTKIDKKRILESFSEFQ